MKRRFLWLLGIMCLLAVVIPVLSFFSPIPAPGELLRPLVLRSPDGEEITLQVEEAITQKQHAVGLMNRPVVRDGMLFVFEVEKPLSFWMKNTLVPLDILFFSEDGNFVSSTTMEPCAADPCPQYPSEAPARYALEMPQGFLKTHPVGENWKIVR